MAKILVVDDERAVLDGLVAYLGRPSVEIEVAENLDEARERMAAGEFDLVLSDLRMSNPAGTEGLELLREVRMGGRSRFALMTGFATEQVEREAREIGVDAFLPKPLDLSALERLLEEILVGDEPEELTPGKAKKRYRLSDEEAGVLLERYNTAGDQQALSTLLEEFGGLVYSVPIKWYGLAKSEADDVYQDVAVQLLLKSKQIRNVRLWLIGTAVNCTRRRLASSARSARLAERWCAEEQRRQSIHVDVEADLRRTLEDAVDALPPRQRQLIRAIYYEGLSYQEISAKFGIPEGSIGPTRGRIARALIAATRESGFAAAAPRREAAA